MADISTCKGLSPASIAAAHELIKPYIHLTPLITSRTLDLIASTSHDGFPAPRLRLWFKCENLQKIGAFKARGAHHAVLHLIEELGLEEVQRRGVVTHSSGNHAQALALAASTFSIPAHIVMPTISTPSKIAGTKAYTKHVRFSGSTSSEREEVVRQVIEETEAILVPPYDHPDIMLGQGTAALEMLQQYKDASERENLDMVIAPLGGGGLLSGTATFFSDRQTYVFGAEPSYQGGNDGEIGLSQNPPKRIEHVKTLTIADGLRTPVGVNPWKVFTSGNEYKVKILEGIYSVTEQQIKDALKLVMERMKMFVEPSAVVPLAALLYNDELRGWIYKKQEEQGGGEWDVGVIFSGGNTTIEAIIEMFSEKGTVNGSRAEGMIGSDGLKVAEDVAG